MRSILKCRRTLIAVLCIGASVYKPEIAGALSSIAIAIAGANAAQAVWQREAGRGEAGK